MANLSAFNRITKLQKILLYSNLNNLLQPTSTVATNSALKAFFHKQHQHTQEQQPSSPKLTKPYCTRYNSFSRNFTTGTQSTSKSTNIDEFRAREEKREEEFNKQQSESPPDEKEQENARQAKTDIVRMKILDAALKHVPAEGWSRQAIIQGAEEAGYPSEVHGMFPSGGYELVSHFVGKCNEALLKHMQAETNNGQKEVADPLDFLIRSVKFRLQMIEPYKSHWPQAMALIALPPNVPTSLAQVLTMVDDMCYYSGDRSVDFGWYTRRVGLATIFKMVEVFMLQDSSPDHQETWTFLKNRMEEAAQIQMVLAQTGDMTNNFQRSFNSAFVTARNILGLNYNRR
ncbi:ubiquinone biosynthesis protein COQ9, mitochondrial [Eupeodes corollae]|uniref:ubiquinone biosynthesis protein COQ9, mitochondrial n=1 Tax=Eupeodes corollae TaxID=290404 RepID=UPI0024932016|nr:ubiquinone biosynthesis protein COQ9, mitochondrial [Eupeodes corollae]